VAFAAASDANSGETGADLFTDRDCRGSATVGASPVSSTLRRMRPASKIALVSPESRALAANVKTTGFAKTAHVEIRASTTLSHGFGEGVRARDDERRSSRDGTGAPPKSPTRPTQ
jgi:hypothetical protein